FDPADIAKRRFRFVRSEASVLLGGGGAISPDIHPADLAGLMARYNMRLIATGVTIEQTAIDLLDYDVPLAQGDLFSAPRPVRSDILAEDQPVESGRRATG
ncbi:MAG: EAL domain-containing protein, partial [Rhodobiaceae bacterium]|nr:EAL domain-containing protein [Rhodobiaceae bacterium]